MKLHNWLRKNTKKTRTSPIMLVGLRMFFINFIESFSFAKVSPAFLNIVVAPFFILPSLCFTGLLLAIDQRARQEGFSAALGFGLGHYYGPTETKGGTPPAQGPLLVVANHPGLGDFPSLVASLGRKDIKVIIKERALMIPLTAILDSCIIINETLESRAKAILSAVDHLASGGCLVIFPAGEIEEDPALYPTYPGKDYFKPWFPIVDGITKRYLRKYPSLAVQGALIRRVYFVPTMLRWMVYRGSDSAIRSGRAALITMALPKTSQKRIEVNFLPLIEISTETKVPIEGFTQIIKEQFIRQSKNIACTDTTGVSYLQR